jgi:hypothetical protein
MEITQEAEKVVSRTTSSWKSWTLRLVLAGCSILVGLAGVELLLRTFAPYSAHHAGREMTDLRHEGKDAADLFVIDQRMGFRPRLPSPGYSEFGTIRNTYPLEKQPGRTRLLFVGDSVTARGRIVAAIRRCYGDRQYEYWNAGVESFNTVQELMYYKLFNYRVQPDHVILQFHLNDFETTPVSFLAADGGLVVYSPKCPAREINRYLFEHCHLYRLYVGLTTRKAAGFERIAGEVKEALQEFQEIVKPADLTVLIFTCLKPEEEWNPREKLEYEEIRRILAELQIRHFDLKPLALAAAQEGISLQETAGDTWHPSDAFADYVAAHLQQEKLLSVR